MCWPLCWSRSQLRIEPPAPDRVRGRRPGAEPLGSSVRRPGDHLSCTCKTCKPAGSLFPRLIHLTRPQSCNPRSMQRTGARPPPKGTDLPDLSDRKRGRRHSRRVRLKKQKKMADCGHAALGIRGRPVCRLSDVSVGFAPRTPARPSASRRLARAAVTGAAFRPTSGPLSASSAACAQAAGPASPSPPPSASGPG